MSDPPKKPARGRPKTLRKADVIDVAVQAYWEDGPTEVSLNAICQRAGVSKPSVYREFGNDDGLTRAALESYGHSVLARAQGILGGPGGFAEKIRAIAHLMAQDDTHEKGCLYIKMRAAKPHLGPQTQALIEEMDRMALNAYAHLIDGARATGEYAGDVPADVGARYLLGQIGLALDQRARGEDPRATLALALTVFDVDVAFDGQAAPGDG